MSDLIETSKGMLPRDTLRYVETVTEHPGGTVYAQEYWLGEELVKRGITVALKGKEFKFDGGFAAQ